MPSFNSPLAQRVRALLSGRQDLVEKHMFGGVCFMLNGHMAMGTSKERLMVRLDPEAADQLLGTAHVSPMDFTGKPMRGFLFVEAAGVAGDATLQVWVERCVSYAESRPAKNTTNSRSKSKGRRDRR